ncbi:DNA-directed RNA polymerase I subunit RPA34 [Genypterus blacodes]|uniref:DNA-directed RNA polymerase I subunit RPA34 n=1 Tax=Genypterus blacodes TaxID=154954 RepID=UPI003F75AB84
MPRDVSSSSASEDEAHNSTAPSPAKRKQTVKKNSKYQCPGDFVSFCHKPCSTTLTDKLKDDNNELWLIKVPGSFEPECFRGIKVPLSGFQTLKVAAPVDGTKAGIYSIMASTHRTSELRLLTGHKRSSDSVAFGPAFSGLLNVCETCGDSSTNLAPQIIPATPAPSIPPGLKQRFHPFGSKTPALSCMAESEVDGASSKPAVVEAEEEEEGKKKKKKRKKEKHIKTEPMEEGVKVKEEPVCESPTQDVVMMELPSQDGEGSEEKRKKKKKKKDKDREKQEEVEAELVPEVKEEEVTVKCERVDASEADALDASGKKKKKKKKKSKTADD